MSSNFTGDMRMPFIEGRHMNLTSDPAIAVDINDDFITMLLILWISEAFAL